MTSAGHGKREADVDRPVVRLLAAVYSTCKLSLSSYKDIASREKSEETKI